MEFRLPDEEIATLKNIIAIVIRRKIVTLKDMQKLIGLLAFVSRVLPIGRMFSRNFYLSISGFKSPTYDIRITT